MVHNQLHAIDLIIIAAYLISMVLIGVVVVKKVQSMDDYYLIMVKAIRPPKITLVVLPKRCSKRSGIEVTWNVVPTAEIRPAKPEKINIPRR
mgnify:CR=1 FL=1